MSEDDAKPQPDETPTELEWKLAALMNGEIGHQDFLRAFLSAPVYIMVNGEPQDSLLGDKQPMVIAASVDAPRMLAVFATPHRATRMIEQFSDYSYPILVSADWVFEHIGPNMGVSFNPGCRSGFELAPEGAQQLKEALKQPTGKAE